MKKSYGHRQVPDKMKTFSPVYPHFRKRLVPPTLLLNKLRIPKEFMKKYGRTISESVLIRVPTGKEFELELENDKNGDFWLKKGWSEFAKHHSLENEQTLLFRYKGCSEFDVVIIGTNGLEIDYPTNESDIDADDDDDNNNEADDGDGDGDGDDVVFPGRKIVETSSPPPPLSRKRMKISHGDNHTNQCSSHEEMTRNDPMRKGDSDGKLQVLGTNQRPLSISEKANNLPKTRDFTSQHPYFKVVIQRSNLDPEYRLNFPTHFWRQHLKGKSGKDATLCASHGRNSLVKLHAKDVGRKEQLRASFLRRGWKAFAQKNNLEIRDVCIFELVDNKNITFNVSIERYKQNSQLTQVGKSVDIDQDQNNLRSRLQTKSDKIGKPPSKDHICSPVTYIMPSCLTTNPYFKMELHSFCCQKLQVPARFAERYLGQKTQNVTLEVGKRMWQVRMEVCFGVHIFSGGWPTFVRDNDLRDGVICSFELVRREEDHVVFEVTKHFSTNF
ncbi:hypothetical protein TIFTF001_036037 [Ficus carica]|uniref:TF-B3 domain-containing protein n=1 Tax=Ficus carica TaxID=3494 RepID=A0AA88E6W6_FICCA|nr:hypothetical protein TIFTF001_036037 [Ficus carica]